MKKENTKLTRRQMDEIQALKDLPDDQIDTTDIPEIVDWSDARRGVFHRRAKEGSTKKATSSLRFHQRFSQLTN